MTLDEINRLVKCNGDEDPDDDVSIQFSKAKHATNKAVLVIIDDEKVWLPYSHLIHWWPESMEAQISAYIAGEKGLL